MNRNHLWKLLLVIFVVAWACFELYPPKGRSIIQVFQERVPPVRRDAEFSNIVQRANQLQTQFPERNYGNLKEAVGTNDLARYFPHIDVKGEKNPSTFILNRLQRDAAGKIRLGLDLRGGTSFLVAMDTNKLSALTERETALGNAVEVLRRRVDSLGVAEPVLQPQGTDRILIQLPGISEAEKEAARRQIERAAFLELRIVHPESNEHIAQGIPVPGYDLLKEEIRDRKTGEKALRPYLVKIGAERGLTGKYIKRAQVARKDLTNEPEILFELNDEGAKLFADITREYAPKGNKKYQLAIVLDGELYSAPEINEPIEGGRASISGRFDLKEAFELANILENPLEAPVKVIEERTVEPSLGSDSIKSGLRASYVGTALVAGFMACYYLLAGLVANFALLLNIVILLGVMCSIDATLTLPGIAGIVLTIGMAVDANVLIFERIREELEAGKSLRGAVSAGYNKAFWTIFDANLTTLISSAILIYMGTGPVKGFGVTLTIGVMVSMFTALLVTRLVFDFLLAKNLIKSLPMLHFIKPTKIDFLRWAVPAFMASWLLIAIGIGYGIYRGDDVLGVDFAGGDAMTIGFDKKINQDQLRDVIGKLGVGDATLQPQKDMISGKETLLVTTRSLEAGGKDSSEVVVKGLQEKFPDSKFRILSVDRVGPTVGAEILRTAIVSVLLAMLGILIYVAFRYEFSFSIGAIVAIFHDVLMTLGWFFLSGRELSAPMVAAILTIIGFSINDTIVIFDRIREDLKLGVRGSFKDVINIALNQTLSRTIITSGTVLLATLSLYLFGGGVINDFAFTFLVGIITGCYSTIYIASAIVLWWHKGQKPSIASPVMMDETVPGPKAVPARA